MNRNHDKRHVHYIPTITLEEIMQIPCCDNKSKAGRGFIMTDKAHDYLACIWRNPFTTGLNHALEVTA